MHGAAPRVVTGEAVAGARDRRAVSLGVCGQIIDACGTRKAQRPVRESGVGWLGGGRTCRPDVRADVVVVPAGGEERCARVAPEDAVEHESLVVVRMGARKVRHVEVDVPDEGPFGHAVSRLALSCARETREVEGAGIDGALTILATSRGGGPAGVHLGTPGCRDLRGRSGGWLH